MKKILVIDGNSIINRAFYGVRPLSTKSGKPTNAIYGMINIITKQMNAVKPDYAAVAFDVKHPTFRHEMYAEYKAGRHATPEDLLAQFKDAKECLIALGLHVLELPGYEADDIQGTIAKMAHQYENTESYILSGDRDLLQLIDDKVTVLLATNSDTLVMKKDEFRLKYGIDPSQFVDMKALMGDSSDNIPGVAGVGEKTAASLIQNFGSLDGIYENIEDSRISKGVREKLLRDKENAYLSQKLAKIITNVDIITNIEEISYTGIKNGELYKKLCELELNSFITKFALTKDLEKNEPISESCEAMPCSEIDDKGLMKLGARRIALQIIENAIYICADDKSYRYTASPDKLLDFMVEREVICYDAKSICHKLGAQAGEIDDIEFLDLMLYAYLLNPTGSEGGIAPLCSMFLSKTVASGTPCVNLFDELERKLAQKIEDDGLSQVLTKLELPLLKVLFNVEKRGFMINPEGIEDFAIQLRQLADYLAECIYEKAGERFNINSPKQLGEILYVKLGLVGAKKTKSGYSTSAEALEELRASSPIIDDILEYRQVTKLLGTYTSSLTDVADGEHRIHTDFKQALTATGRLSSTEPNLQNIPIKTKMGRELRRYFVAKNGYTLIDADYSQIELRILAHISDDYNMKDAFILGEDIHTGTASAVFHVQKEDVTPEMRKRAKAVNFGIIYGIGGYSLAKDIGTTTAEANGYIKSYLMNYPGIDEYLTNVVKEATEKGYTVTPMGRRRYIPELTASNGMIRAFGKRVAMNAPIQGAAADVMKLAMINVEKRLKSEKIDGGIVMQVHDELILEVRDDNVAQAKAILKEEMESAVKLSIPLTVDVTTGKNWLEQQ